MRICLITQDDPFFLGENIDFLINNLPAGSQISSCILLDASPFGKQESTLQKAKRTYKVFGFSFLIHYTIEFIFNKISFKKTVASVLSHYGIPLVKLRKNINHDESLRQIGSFNPDLLISIAGNQIFKKKLIDLAPKGCLNLHTALLPKYRGLMPSFWVLKNNEKQTGVSVFFVDEGIDSGPIIVQKTVDIKEKTQKELIKETKHLGMLAIIEAIEKIVTGHYDLIPNPESEKTYFSFPTSDDVKQFQRLGKRFF